MANRRQFLEQALISCGIVGFTGRTMAFVTYLGALFATKPKLLPEGWEFYEIGGQVLFPVYGSSGGLTSMNVCYLIQKVGKQTYAIAVSFNDMELHATDDDRSIERLVAFKLKEAIRKIKPTAVDMDGGELPLPEGLNG